MLVSIITCLVVTFAALGWIGWRYFALPRPALGAVGAPTPALPAASRADTAGAEQLQLTRRYGFRVHGPLLLAFILVSLSAAGVLALSGRITLDPLAAPDLVRQQHIQATLNPEPLVPPPTLPPSTFVGTDRPGLETADRDWGKLNPEFVAVVLKVFARLESRGYPFALLEGYRSPGRQDALATAGTHVTNARAFQSKHQYGLALDAAPIRYGQLVISEKDAWAMQAYLALGEEAEKAGLTWGGRWKLKDYGHVEAAGSIGQYAKRN